MIKKILLLFALLVIIFSSSANSLPPEIKIYLNTHPEIKTAEMSLELRKDQDKNKSWLLYPFDANLEMSSGLPYENNPFDADISLNYVFLDTSKWQDKTSRQYLDQASQAGITWIKKQLFFSLLKQLLTLESLQNESEAITRKTEYLKEIEEGTRKKSSYGFASRVEVNYSLSNSIQSEAEKVAAESEYSILKQKISHQLKMDSPPKASSMISFSQIDPENICKAASAESFPERDDLRQMELLLSASLQENSQYSRNYIPQLGLKTGVYNLLGGSPQLRTALTIQLPIGAIPFKNGQKAIEKLEIEISGIRLAARIEELGCLIYESGMRLTSIKKEIKLYETAIESSLSAISGMKKEFDSGTISAYDFIRAEQKHFDMELYLNKLHYSYKLEYLKYLYLSGVLDVE